MENSGKAVALASAVGLFKVKNVHNEYTAEEMNVWDETRWIVLGMEKEFSDIDSRQVMWFFVE